MTPTLHYESVASSSTDHLPSSARPQSIMESVASSTDHIPASTSPQNLIVNPTERLPSSSYPTTSSNAFQIKSEHQQQQHHHPQQHHLQQPQLVGKYSQMPNNHQAEENIAPTNEIMSTSGHGHIHDMVDTHQMDYLSNTPMCLPSQSNSNG